ncbi:hypothetical protein DH2020_013544 [Rehmannia glutinosa]|uniref:SAM domain-containing protein n=1 Tax=Rehmannia glutinosa TaxID=99300 RepID=A0ABR0X387_REHGL
MANSSQLPARTRKQNGAAVGGGDASGEVNGGGPTKRIRRPNIRLHESYYELGASFRKGLKGPRKPRNTKTANAKNFRKSIGSSDSSNGEGTKDLNFDDGDDVAIGNWENLNTGERDRVLKWRTKRKRIKPSCENGIQENEKFDLCSNGESEKQREIEEQEREEDNLCGNGVNVNLEDKDFSPHCSSGNDKLIDDDLIGICPNNTDRNGVRVWLNRLGLSKYAPLFEVHEVDDEVLPFLTLEDLKDMGINAVGSRRKMYRSIQKLGEGFS